MINSWYSDRMGLDSAFQNGAIPAGANAGGEPVAQPWQIMNQVLGLGESGLSQSKGLYTRAQPGYNKFPQSIQDSPSYSLGAQLSNVGNAIQRVPGTASSYLTMKDALAQLHNKPQEWLANFTARMYNAGMYQDKAYSKGSKPPDGKVVTDDDIVATINLISTAQRYGDTKTVDEILNEFAAAGEGQKKMDAANKKTQGQVYNIVTDDPATLRAQVTKVAQAVLGRAVSTQEQDALVNQMIAAERAPQQAAVSAGQATDKGVDTVLSTARVDAEARLKESLEAKNAPEAGAYQELNYYNLLGQALGGNH